jgi:hypothetical protein
MTIEYTLNENDLLTLQLFNASKSETIRKKRQRSRLRVPVAYAAMGLVFLFRDNLTMAIVFISIAPLWYFLYPLWERQQYIKNYKGFITDNQKDKIGKLVTLEISNDFIVGKDSGSESTVATTEVEAINEIPTAVLIRIKGGSTFIIPKDKISAFNALTNQLKELAVYRKLDYNIDNNWAWK